MSDFGAEMQSMAESAVDSPAGVESRDLLERMESVADTSPEAPAAATETPSTQVPAGSEAPAAPTAETPPAEEAITPEALAELRQRAQRAQTLDQFEENFRRDPAGMLEHFANGLQPQERAALLQRLGGQAQPAEQPDTPPEFEAESDVERDYLSLRPALQQLPQQVESLAQGAQQAFQQYAGYLHETQTELSATRAELNALKEFLGLKFPAFDYRKAAEEALRSNPNASYADIVQGHATAAKQAAEMAKQARKARPQTPTGNAQMGAQVPKSKRLDLGARMEHNASQ